MPEPTVAVVMATWAGARFVREQLESIMRQDQQPDVLLVRDDASTDATRSVVADALRTAPFPWRLSVNDQRRGPVSTFAALLAGADCDIVVLSDQDDTWRTDRLRVLRAALARPDVDAVFHNASLIDGDGNSLAGDLWSSVGFKGRYRRMFERSPLQLLLNRNVATGATLAARASLVRRALPIGEATWHDHWLALFAAATGQLLALDEPLINYRLHGGNAAGVPAPGRVNRLRDRHRRPGARREDVIRYGLLADRLRRVGANADAVRLVDRRVTVARRRAELPAPLARRASAIARMVVTADYWRFGSGLRSATYDMVEPWLGAAIPIGPEGTLPTGRLGT